MSADVAYLDTSAFVKLVVAEPESVALKRALKRWPRRATSALVRTESVRALRALGPEVVTEARRQLADLSLLRIDDTLLDRAAELDLLDLRSLDGIHLASALSLGDDLAAIFTYDRRMAAGAKALGLPVARPV